MALLFFSPFPLSFRGFDEIMLPSRIKAVVGLHKISEFDPNNGIGDQKNGKAYAVDFQKIVVHPSYDCRRSNDDIGRINSQIHQFFWSIVLFILLALLHLRTPIAFSSTVQPICVADIKANNTYDDQMAYIAGWGQTHENYEISKLKTALALNPIVQWISKFKVIELMYCKALKLTCGPITIAKIPFRSNIKHKPFDRHKCARVNDRAVLMLAGYGIHRKINYVWMSF